MFSDILKLEQSQHNQQFDLTIDTGKRKFNFSFQERFLMEKWLSAFNISRKTAQEQLYSITGKTKNILRIV